MVSGYGGVQQCFSSDRSDFVLDDLSEPVEERVGDRGRVESMNLEGLQRLLIALTPAQLSIPKGLLPDRLLISIWPPERAERFPILDPFHQRRKIKGRRGTAQVDVVRHHYISPDVPFIRSFPCTRYEIMNIRPAENRLTLVCAALIVQ